MKVQWTWLEELVTLPLSPEALADRLTMTGTEVEALESPCGAARGIRVGRIRSWEPHPQKGTLLVARVDLGGPEVSVVTGAANAEAGQLYPYAPPGARLADGTEMGSRDFDGISSEGMLLSAAELGLEGLDDEGGLLRLPEDAPAGGDFLAWAGLDRPVLDLSITPNRGDLCSLLGVAREVHGLVEGTELLGPLTLDASGDAAWTESFGGIRLEDPGCLQYALGYGENLTVAPAPFHARLRLLLAGMRPVSNVVDATNLAMLLFGQPLHAFDRDRIPGSDIGVRSARPGERLVTLDGKERVLEEQDLVIVSGDELIGLAGVMGGLDSEIVPETKRILLESAVFEPSRVSRTSRRLGLPSQAAFRFSRGLDPARVLPAAQYVLDLLVRWGGLRPGDRILHRFSQLPGPRTVSLRRETLRRVLLWDDLTEASRGLARLGFEVSPQEGSGEDRVLFRVPSWRNDVQAEEDLVEEAGRLRGYERIEPRIPGCLHGRGVLPETFGALRQVRQAALARGYVEVMTYSFLHPRELQRLRLPEGDRRRTPAGLLNPISQEQVAMRTCILPGLLRALEQNLRSGWRGAMRFFEAGNVFFPDSEGYREEEHLAGLFYRGKDRHVLYGDRLQEDFLTVKGDVEALLAARGIAARWEEGQEPFGHRGQTARILRDGEVLGSLCRLKPALARELDAEEGIYVFELGLAGLLPAVRGTYGAPFRFPPSQRDVALLVPWDRPASAVREEILSLADPELARQVELFDQFSGKGIPEGTRSLAFSVLYRHPDRTLRDEEVEGAHQELRRKLAEKGYTLR